MVSFSVVTPTFNRESMITRSIDSSLAFVRAVGSAEVVVVDDASCDGTVDVVRKRYAGEIAAGLLTLIVQRANGGVTAARNEAIAVARGDWLILIDSDDELLPTASSAIPPFAASHPNAPVLFFRCEDEAGALIGPLCPPGPLDLTALLTRGTPGECMPVIARSALADRPFDGELRGHELLAYLRLTARNGPAELSDTVVRRYGTSGAGRLSSRSERLRRAGNMARGYALILREFGHLLPLRRRLGLAIRILAYRMGAVFAAGTFAVRK
jgi:glycosyltransferase involved in cell wall biosynthesis